MSAPSRPGGGVKRREFLKILGVGGAAGATVGCGIEDPGKLVPYLVQPENIVPGVSTYFATTCRECAGGCGVIAEVRDGRAIKLEGNPAHPLNRGALCARGQAALQGLYNPDRYRTPMLRLGNELVPTTWDQALTTLSRWLGELRDANVAGNAVFINEHESGTFPAFLDQWLAAYGIPPHISYDAVADTTAMEANRLAYGAAWPGLRFQDARLIVSFGADFLEDWGASIPQQLAFADARARLDGAPRFVYIAPRRSLTGMNADEWIPAAPGSEAAIAEALLGRVSLAEAAEQSGVPVPILERLNAAVREARPGLVLAGGTMANGPRLTAAVAELNRTLGNVGTTIVPDEAAVGYERVASFGDLVGVVRRMQAGQVPLLMVRGANPAYSTPSPLGFAEAMRQVPRKISFSSYPDETSEMCDLILPDHHPLESWGDAQVLPGIVGMQQPVMNPVFTTRQTADVLIAVAKLDEQLAQRYGVNDYREYLMSRFPGGIERFTTALRDGLAPGTTIPAISPPRRGPSPAAADAPVAGEAPEGDFYVVVYPHTVLGDGRGANKPLLQELPDPVSKICWQSWIEIHPQAAERLGVDNGDILRVETEAGAIEAPAWIYLGVRPDTVAVALGQGHDRYGRYASGTGVNAYRIAPVVQDASGGLVWRGTRARVTPTGEDVPLVTTEGSARQHGRGVAQAITAADYARGPAGAHAPETHEPGVMLPEEEAHEIPGAEPNVYLPGLRAPVAADAEGNFESLESIQQGMYDPDHWSRMASHRWAMAIDLARCTGCSACVTACYVENNIPTVGALYQQQHTYGPPSMPGANIVKGREMTWLRIERYFEGGELEPSDFEVRFVPMLCQHCGNAPCEPVCPVYATYHSPDGLNVQVYNRCVGTRYCSNNCPYKVRYFNWFGYGEPERSQYAWPEPLHWGLNPDVTVRGKGVMEKCTFCVQRIREAEHRAKVENRQLRPDEFTTACAATCPSRAITFGDAADPAWAINEYVNDRRRYHVFEELNTFTAVIYLRKVVHPAPALPAGA